MNIGRTIQLLLDKQHKTQIELARHIFVNPTTVNRYLTGKRNIKLETLVKIAEFFNVSTDCLLGLEKPESNIAFITFNGETRIYKEIKPSDEDYDSIINIINKY